MENLYGGFITKYGTLPSYLGNICFPYLTIKKIKWDSKNDNAYGLIEIPISNDLQFHLQGIEKPNVAWQKLETMFGKHNEIQAHQLKNQLISLYTNDFSCI
jgi:hypothetical protein